MLLLMRKVVVYMNLDELTKKRGQVKTTPFPISEVHCNSRLGAFKNAYR